MEIGQHKPGWVSLACPLAASSALPNLSTYLSALWPWWSHVMGPAGCGCWPRPQAAGLSLSLFESCATPRPPAVWSFVLRVWGFCHRLGAGPALGFSEFTALNAQSAPLSPLALWWSWLAARAAPANQWFEEALCSMSLFHPLFLEFRPFPPSNATLWGSCGAGRKSCPKG